MPPTMDQATFTLLVTNHAVQIKQRLDYHHGIVNGMMDIAGRMHGHAFQSDLAAYVLGEIDKKGL